MRTLRVGIFTEIFGPVRNGVVASVDMLVSELRRRDHDVICVTPMLPDCNRSQPGVLRLPSLPLPTRTAYRLTIPFLTSERLAALESREIVHTHSPFVTGWMGLRLARRLRVPLVFTYHTQLEQYVHYFPCDPHIARCAATWMTRTYANAADMVLVPTAAMERRLRAIGVRKRIEVVPTGIDVASFGAGRRSPELREQLGAAPGEPLVLLVGRLGREKNCVLALEAVARLPHLRLAVVGEGPDRASLELLAARLAPGRVRFLGELPREELPSIYASSEALLFTSASETQGLVLVEALAAGLPIVTIDTPQGREVLGAAALYCSADPQGLALGISAVLGEEPVQRAKRLALAPCYDTRASVERVLAIYMSLLARS